jgi:predicted metalloenzyme YecM
VISYRAFHPAPIVCCTHMPNAQVSTQEALLVGAGLFITHLLTTLVDRGFPVTLHVDHVCWRCGSEAEYARKHEELSNLGRVLVQAPVGGRMITTVKLHVPIRYTLPAGHGDVMYGETWLVELPNVKSGSAYSSGWEHAEMVLPVGETLASWRMRHPHPEWDVSGEGKECNADIRLPLPLPAAGADALYLCDRISVKFHLASLEEVIAVELATAAAAANA